MQMEADGIFVGGARRQPAAIRRLKAVLAVERAPVRAQPDQARVDDPESGA